MSLPSRACPSGLRRPGNVWLGHPLPFPMSETLTGPDYAATGASSAAGPRHRGEPIGRVANFRSRSPAATRHERTTESEIAKRLAALRGERYAGDYDANAGEHVTYFVPDDTLLSATATDLGIRTDQDLFGGVVPFAFVATKAISHPIAPDATQAPLGWPTVLAERIRNVV